MDDNSLKNNGINPAIWPVLSLQSRAAARLFLRQKTAVSPQEKIEQEVRVYYRRRSAASKEFTLLHDLEPVEGDLLRYDEIQKTTGVDWCDWLRCVEPDSLPLAEGQQVERNGYRLKVQGATIYRTLTTEEQSRWERGIWPTLLWSPLKDSEWWMSPLSNIKSRWCKVEEEALGLQAGRHHPTEPLPTIPAVTFLGAIDGKHRCRPATDAEIAAR